MGKRLHPAWFLIILAGLALSPGLWGFGADEPVGTAGALTASATGEEQAATAEGEAAGMTLYELLAAGGWVMIPIYALSILGLALVIYFGVTLNEKNLVPKDQVVQIRHFLRDGRYDDIVRLCRRSKGLFAKVVIAGITRGSNDPIAVTAAMETVGRRESETLMRRIHFLSDIAVVSPMLGLLGTVLGMINAFNLIAFDLSVAKPVAMAGAIAQALITTAAGLIVAIPCMGFYYFYCSKLQAMVGKVEDVAVEITDHLTVKPAE